MAYYARTHAGAGNRLQLYLRPVFCPHYSPSFFTLTNSTCWAGCCSSPADQSTGSSEADFIFVNDRCVNVHLCLDLCSHLYFFCPHFFSRIRVACDVISWSQSLLCFVPAPPPSEYSSKQEFLCRFCFSSQPYFVRCPICCMGRGWHWWTACSRLCLSRTVGMYR